ncbi:unnamed protein product [Linum tenue]|uniref:Uncharacterized protein n=1 Tax=Linum tenue TaxID=586396 RepID=A0AAV0QJB6_9ROSI|nr:unnamed protein product [Linum tenue]
MRCSGCRWWGSILLTRTESVGSRFKMRCEC